MLSCNLVMSPVSNFSTASLDDLNYHVARKETAPKPDFTFSCKICNQDSPGFYALRQHKNTQYGFPNKTTYAEPDDVMNEMTDMNLKWELRSCHSFSVDSDVERARHKVFNYAVENRNETVVKNNLDHFIDNLKCSAKVNLAFGFILKKIEVESSDVFTHTKLTPCWTDRHLCAPGTTWRVSRNTSTKMTSSSHAVEKKWKQSGNSSSCQT